MKVSDTPFLADWFAITLRWLAVLGLATAIASHGSLTILSGAMLLGLVLWNIYVLALAITNRRMPSHRPLNLGMDLIIAMALYWTSGRLMGAVAWAGILPVFSAAIYYELSGSLLVGLLFSLMQAFPLAWMPPAERAAALAPLAQAGLTNMIVALVMGLLSRGLMNYLRGEYQTQIRSRREVEQQVKREEHDRMQAFYDLTATLSTTLNYQKVLDTALDLGAAMMDDTAHSMERIVSAALLFEGDHLKIGCSRRMSSVDERATFPADQGALARAVQSADPLVIADPNQDPELKNILALESFHSAACVSLRTGMNVYGVLLFAHPDPDYFNADRLEVMEMITHQAVIAIQNALLYQNLEKEKERMIEIQEEARNKLARDLHDGPTQSVAAIAMRLNYIRILLQKDERAAAEELVKTEELARRTTKEIRTMLFTLRPLVLESQGLAAALTSMGEKMAETYGQRVVVNVDPRVVDCLEIGKQTVVFYLAEEAVNNARKHAQAACISVTLQSLAKAPDIALLQIADDGVGFDVQQVNASYDQRGSLGMVNLKERSELVNGLLHLESAPGKGTRVQVFIPLNEEAADRLRRSVH